LRIRILKWQSGDVDGVPLAGFQAGEIYEVDASVATYLIMTDSAMPVDPQSGTLDETASSSATHAPVDKTNSKALTYLLFGQKPAAGA